MHTYLINTLQLITAINLKIKNIFQLIPNIPKILCRFMDLSDEKV